MEIEWTFVLICVVVVVGLLQWLKTFIKTAKSWIWGLAFLVAAFAVTAAMQYLPMWIRLALIVLAVGQLGYENVIQLVKNKLNLAGTKSGTP